MNKLKAWWASRSTPTRFLAVAVIVAIVVAGGLLLTGCAVPSAMEGTLSPDGNIALHTTTVDAVVPLTGLSVQTSTLTQPPPGMGVWAIVGLALGGIGALQFAGPKSWANWLTILKPSTSWGGTGQALAANLGIAHTPAESKSPPATGV